MKLLLDTHAFIWWYSHHAKLSTAALAACQSPTNSLHLSLASVWEMQIKIQLGKLTLRLPLADVLRDHLQSLFSSVKRTHCSAPVATCPS
ncbi:MAG: type II toxin-antitoxin system VapC family toxin [Chthoniobacterales bacterium]|nr:type II toxin-antitoxin system VapC family toxin [Chthoniobacterales bacterium]